MKEATESSGQWPRVVMRSCQSHIRGEPRTVPDRIHSWCQKMLLLLLAEPHGLGCFASLEHLDPCIGSQTFMVSSLLWRITLKKSFGEKGSFTLIFVRILTQIKAWYWGVEVLPCRMEKTQLKSINYQEYICCRLIFRLSMSVEIDLVTWGSTGATLFCLVTPKQGIQWGEPTQSVCNMQSSVMWFAGKCKFV